MIRLIKEQDVEIDVKHEGILEVPEGKNVEDLPMSHFEKLAKNKGLGKITKALNNLQVWNKKKDPKLSKWAGDMIDKLNKKLKKESVRRRRITESLDEYCVGVFKKTPGKDEYGDFETDFYDELFNFNNYQDAWEEALKWNLKGYFVEIEEWKDGEEEPNTKLFKPGEMKKYMDTPLRKESKRRRMKEDWDRYDPNVEANFMEPGNLYNDMPDLEDLWAANKGLPEEEFVKDALEHGFPQEAIDEFLHPEWFETNDLYKYESKRNTSRRKKIRTERYIGKHYWSYRYDHPFIDRVDNNGSYFTDASIRNIPLLACDNPDDCYNDDPWRIAVEDRDYNGQPLYCTEEQAYKRLKDYLNSTMYERRNDL